MITQKQRIKLKVYLKADYTEDVITVLNNSNKRSPKGLEYTPHMIRQVMAGRENADVEQAILTVYQNRKNAQKKINAKKHRLLAS
ncbi:hypothetical protein [Winogradskyella pulchriflava]|uniref:Uncharacterized protein n=1 Tax=Winogradskyella pulchriflava TaxID=1110688 RepID=A0ABV6QE08_9FLAO